MEIYSVKVCKQRDRHHLSLSCVSHFWAKANLIWGAFPLFPISISIPYQMKFRTISENPKRAFFFLNPFLHFWNFLQMLIKKLTNKSIHISFRILCMCLIEVVTCATPIRDTEAGADMGGLPQYTSILPASPPTRPILTIRLQYSSNQYSHRPWNPKDCSSCNRLNAHVC